MLFQIDTTALEEVLIPAEEPVQESINLFEMAQYGGWIMIILAILQLLYLIKVMIQRE